MATIMTQAEATATTRAPAGPGGVARPFRVASDPGRGMNNPYVDLFYDAAERRGVTLLEDTPRLTCRWLREHAGRVEAIHVHWPEDCWRVHLRRMRARAPWFFRVPVLPGLLIRALTAYRLFRLRQFFAEARARGVRLLWTLHNIEPHEGAWPLDGAGYRMLARHADAVLVHSEGSRREFLRRHRPGGSVLVVPHGNYDGAYPPPSRPREEVLRGLGLDPALPAVCCLGGLREYKGIDTACEAVAQLGGRVQLIIGGPPHPDYDVEGLRRRLAGLPGAALAARRLSAAEFSDLASACEAVLLPYRKTTTSGALLAALTLGRGVVASDLPFFREVLDGHPQAGVLAHPAGDPEALARAITAYLEVPAEQRARAARALADRYAWDLVIEPVAQLIAAWAVPHHGGQASP